MADNILGQLWSPISSGYEDLKGALKLGLKDIIGSITYAFQLTFTYNEEKLNRLIQNRRETLDRIAIEYSQRWSSFSKEMGPEFSMMTFFMAPGPYIAAYISSNSRADLGLIVRGLKDAGVPTNSIVKLFDLSGIDYPPRGRQRAGDGDERVDDDARYALASLYTRNTDGMQRSELERLLRGINSKLSDVYGLERRRGPGGVREAIENRENIFRLNEGVYDNISSSFRKVLSKHAKEFASVVEIDSKEFVTAKAQQLKSYVNVCNCVESFLEKIGDATTMEEITEAYEYLGKNSPFEIDGMDSNPMGRVEKIVDANYVKIKNEPESLKKLIDAIGVQVRETGESIDSMKEIDAKKAILKIQIIKEIENIKRIVVSDKFKKSVDEVKTKLYKDFMKDIDVNSVRRMDKNSELYKLIASATKNLKPSSLP